MKIKTGVRLLLVAALPVATQAAEYSVTPFASARVEADTNKRLTVLDSKTTFGTILEAGALLNYATEETNISATPRLAISKYSDDGTGFDQDSEDYYFDLSGNHRFNERWSGGAFFNYSNVGVVSSELEDLGVVLGNSNIFSSGEIFAPENFSRQTISIGPSLTYIFSEKDTFSLGASYTDAAYDRQDTALSDYNSTSVNFSWTHQLNITDQLIATVFMLNQDSDLNFLVRNSVGPNPESLIDEYDQIGFTLGYVKNFSETLLGRVNVGMRQTDGKFPDLIDFDLNLSAESAALINPNTGLPVGAVINRSDPLLSDQNFLRSNPDFLKNSRTVNRVYQQGTVNKSGLIIDASVEKQFETTTIVAGLSRSSLPSGRGLTERDEFYINGTHLFSDRLTGRGSFRYFSTQSESEETLFTFGGRPTDQIRLEAGFDWLWTEFWTVSGGYTYSRRSAEGSDTADGHTIFLMIGYNGNKYAISR